MLTTTTTLTAGDLRYDLHTVSLSLRRGMLPTVDRLDCQLPRQTRVDASIGDRVELELDGGDGSVKVFTGTLTAVGSDASGVHLIAHNGGHDLARSWPAVSLEQLSLGDVVATICDDAGIRVEQRTSGRPPTLARYVALARRTGLDEVTRLTRLAGWLASFDGEGTLVTTDADGGGSGGLTALSGAASAGAALAGLTADSGLRWDRELVGARTVTGAAPEERTVVGEGAGPPESTNGLWPIADFWAGGAAEPGPNVRRRVAHELRSTGDADAAGHAWAGRAGAESSPMTIDCFLVPAVEPGQLIEVSETPEDVSLPAMRVRSVHHHVSPDRGATTRLLGFPGAGR